jgi:NAD(P)-dependent dehydrogenase (short-subunit alcohol dehydrogenase family)
MLISSLGLNPATLRGEVVIVTGAGGGIGFEAARTLAWLGASVVIAEINTAKGVSAVERLAAEFDPQRILFVRTDVGDAASVAALGQEAAARFGRVDAVINNATIAVLGNVVDLPIESWDASYAVNLRGPVLLARQFLPGMIERRHGAFICVSSTGTAFLGGYETFKAAQVHLANTLDAELENTGVSALTIGPGLVPTETASQAVAKLAPQLGMSVEQFFELNKNAVLTIEEAGTGFALAVVFAERFKGQEISSLQALKAADIRFDTSESSAAPRASTGNRSQAKAVCARVLATLKEQSDGWKQRSLFERQWVLRDFRMTAGMPVEEWLAALEHLQVELDGPRALTPPPISRLAAYYTHLGELAKGYEKNPAKLEESLRHVYSWRDDALELARLLA